MSGKMKAEEARERWAPLVVFVDEGGAVLAIWADEEKHEEGLEMGVVRVWWESEGRGRGRGRRGGKEGERRVKRKEARSRGREMKKARQGRVKVK